jgi:hypothetical protein
MLHIYSAFPGGHLTKEAGAHMLRTGVGEKEQFS